MKDRVSLHSTVSLRDELLFADLDRGEAAILNLKNGLYYGLNPVATSIWRFLEEGKRVNKILDFLMNEFPSESRITHDLFELLEQLEKLGLVEISTEPTA